MTPSLEKAFIVASNLEPFEQDSLAAWILAELKSEERWTKAFADSEDLLAALADEALAKYRNSDVSLTDLMDAISERAKDRGLTPETLEAILEDGYKIITYP